MKKLNGLTLNQIMDQLLEGEQADAFVRSLLESGQAELRRVGRDQENWGRIAVASDPAKALMEVVGSNTQDAMSERYVQENNLQDNPPSSPRKAVEARTGFRDGRFNVRTKKGKRLLEDITVSLRGHIRDAQPHKCTIDVRDHGVGVKPHEVANTFCGLGGGGKTRRPYLAGSHGQGSKACFTFANQRRHSAGSTTEMIVTRHWDSNLVTLSFIWFDPRTGHGPTGEICDTGIWKYLVDAETGNPWVFEVPADGEFEAGSLVRIFDYDMGAQACSGIKNKEGEKDFLWNLRNLLPDPLLPLTVKDARTASSKRWKRYLNSSKATFKYEGAVNELSRKKGVEHSAEFVLPLGYNSKATLRYWLFEYDEGVDTLKTYADRNYPISLTLNGQTHGHLDKFIITRDAGLASLNGYLLVVVDVDEMDIESKRELFNSTRESTRNSPTFHALCKNIITLLAEDDNLISYNADYRNRSSSKSTRDEENALREWLNEVFSSSNDKNPGGSQRDSEDKNPRQPTKELPPIPVSDPPTFFDVVGNTTRSVEKGKTFSLRINTDAHPDLFGDPSKFFVDVPYSYVTYTGCTRNDGGRKRFSFRISPNAPSNVTAGLSLVLKPSSNLRFEVSLSVEIEDPAPPEPQDYGLPFRIQYLEDLASLDVYELTSEDASFLALEGSDKVVYVNMLNKNLQARIEAVKDDGRWKDPEGLVKALKLRYKYYAVRSAGVAFQEEMDSETINTELMNLLIKRRTKGALSTYFDMADLHYLKRWRDKIQTD